MPESFTISSPSVFSSARLSYRSLEKEALVRGLPSHCRRRPPPPFVTRQAKTKCPAKYAHNSSTAAHNLSTAWRTSPGSTNHIAATGPLPALTYLNHLTIAPAYCPLAFPHRASCFQQMWVMLRCRRVTG